MAVSSITIDMNMIDFNTMEMFPQVQSVNTVKVYKGAKESDAGFSIFGQSFGLKGSVKKIQGRHAAVRTLVEMCVLELIGKQYNLPYWKCVEGAKEDRNVIRSRKKFFKASNKEIRTALIQQLLPVYGVEEIGITGVYGERTKAAMKEISAVYSHVSPSLTVDFYIDLFKNAPFFTEKKFDVAALNLRIASLPPEKKEKVKTAAVAPEESEKVKTAAVAPEESEKVKTAAVAPEESEKVKTVAVAPNNVQEVVKQSSVKVSEEASNQPAEQSEMEGGFNLEHYQTYMNEAKREFASQNFEKATGLIMEAGSNGVPRDNPEPFLYLAYSAQAMDKIDLARQFLENGLQMAPKSIQLYKTYVRFLVSQNQVEKAKIILDKAISIAPGNKELEYLKSYLKMASK